MRYSYILNMLSLYWNWNISYQDIKIHLIVFNLIDKFLNFCHSPRSLPIPHQPQPFLLIIHMAQLITVYTALESVNKIFGEPIGRTHVELQIDCPFVNDSSPPMHIPPYPPQSKRHRILSSLKYVYQAADKNVIGHHKNVSIL